MSSNYELTQYLIEEGYLKTPEIISAFENIDRADFVSDEYKNEAYEDIPLPIGEGQTISQPLTVAFMLELLQPKKGEKILDIGFGSGWQAVLLAYIVGGFHNEIETDKSKAGVIGIERIQNLKEFGESNVSKYNFDKDFVNLICGDGTKGYKKEAPYDKIIAGAASEGDVPLQWKKQLKIGGRIVAPVGHSIVVIDKLSKNKYTQKEFFGYSFVKLITN